MNQERTAAKNARIMIRPKAAPAPERPSLLPGASVKATVQAVDDHGVRLTFADGKSGIIERGEFDTGPTIGSEIAAVYLIDDPRQEAAVLTTRQPAKEVELAGVNVGDLVSGTVVEAGHGGLGLRCGSIRGFMPASQLSRSDAKALGGFLRQEVAGQVTQVDRKKKEVILSVRTFLDRWTQQLQARRMAGFEKGQRRTGKVVRRTEFGAFIDLGGIDGLLHESKIERHNERLKNAEQDPIVVAQGDELEIEVIHLDVDRGRIALDFPYEGESGGAAAVSSLGDYEVGDSITGIVRSVSSNGAEVFVEDGITGWFPISGDVEERPQSGAVWSFKVTAIDGGKRRIELGR